MAWPRRGDCGPRDLAVISLLSLCSFVDCRVSRALAGAIEAKGISQRLIPRPTTKIARDSWSRELLLRMVVLLVSSKIARGLADANLD